MSMPQYKPHQSDERCDIMMPRDVMPPIVEMLTSQKSYVGKQYILEKSKYKSIQNMLKDRYLHEMNMLVSKSNLAKLGPGCIIEDILFLAHCLFKSDFDGTYYSCSSLPSLLSIFISLNFASH
jgi:hypothetical protein